VIIVIYSMPTRASTQLLWGCLSRSPNVLFLSDWFIYCSEFCAANELILGASYLFIDVIFLLHFVFLRGGCLHFLGVARMSTRLKPFLCFVFKPLHAFPLSLVCNIFIRNE
jgi:hypothetical protein